MSGPEATNDANAGARANVAGDAQPTFNVQRIYLKDASLEIPNSPKIFLETDPPSLEIQLNVGHEMVMDGIYEAVITATLTTRIKEQVGFLVEAKQAGIFEIRNVAAEQLEPLLGIVCPNILYPYLRSNVADLINRTGFPPVHLTEINFEAFYNERRAALAKQQDTASGGLVNTTGLPLQ
jgi:preprotein translocase subunit SecB